MSSQQPKAFNRGDGLPSARQGFMVDGGTTYQSSQQGHFRPPATRAEIEISNPQPQYPTSQISSLESYRQTSRPRSGIGMQSVASETPMQHSAHRLNLSVDMPNQRQVYDTGRLATPAVHDQPLRSYDAAYQSRTGFNTSLPQRYSPRVPQGQPRHLAPNPYPSPPATEKELQSASGQYSRFTPPQVTSAYESATRYVESAARVAPMMDQPPPRSDTFSPQYSLVGSPAPRASPNSLQKELDRTKDYAENILTKLMDTGKLLKERDIEIGQLRSQLANGGTSYQAGDGASSWEVEDLRRRLHDQEQALRATREETTRAHSLAQFHQQQSEQYSQQLFQLRDSVNQRAVPQVDPAQFEDARRLTEFYKQKVDQLSKDIANVNRDNRKLTDDLSNAQREIKQQRSVVESLR